MKKTIVLGASTNPDRYAYIASVKLMKFGHEVVPVGLKEGEINGVEILTGMPLIEDVDTVTLYVGPNHQPAFFDYIVNLKPKRVIFNPGTENPELYAILKKNNIEYIEACTLVMLSIGSY